VRTIFLFVILRPFSQVDGEWLENQILIPDWIYFYCPGLTTLIVEGQKQKKIDWQEPVNLVVGWCGRGQLKSTSSGLTTTKDGQKSLLVLRFGLGLVFSFPAVATLLSSN